MKTFLGTVAILGYMVCLAWGPLYFALPVLVTVLLVIRHERVMAKKIKQIHS